MPFVANGWNVGPAGTVLAMIAAAAVIVAIFWLFGVRERWRNRRVSAWARQSGFQFDAGPRDDVVDAFRSLPLFYSGGGVPNAVNVTWGTHRGMGFCIFDCATGGGSSPVSYGYTVLVLRSPIAVDGALACRPEGLLDKTMAAAGSSDINFESAAFSRAFFVRASRRDLAYEVIQPRMMEYLLANRCFGFEAAGEVLVAYRGLRKLPVASFGSLLAYARGLVEFMPPHLAKNKSAPDTPPNTVTRPTVARPL